MVKIGYIFPGQGAQSVGMGYELYQKYPAARRIFDRADEILDFKVSEACFQGPQEYLKRTDICQPAILTVSLAALEALKTESAGRITPVVCAGLSLGEYTSLVACGALSFEDGLKLVYYRGRYMQEACDQNPGAMASVMGLEANQVEEICRQSGVQIANLNCPGQVVISGASDKLEKGMGLAKEAGAKRVVLLEVAGAFHSSLMDSAGAKLAPKIEEVVINRPGIRHTANISAEYTDDPAGIKKALIAQVSHTTRWADSVRRMAADGVRVFLEIGPGKVLKGLMRKIDPDLQVYNIDSPESVEESIRTLLAA